MEEEKQNQTTQDQQDHRCQHLENCIFKTNKL